MVRMMEDVMLRDQTIKNLKREKKMTQREEMIPERKEMIEEMRGEM